MSFKESVKTGLVLGVAALALGPPTSATAAAVEQVAMASNRGGNFDIYLMNADGSGAVQLTDDPGADIEPAWSPNGQQIAFSSNRDGDFEIFVMNADGTDVVQVTTTDSEAVDRAPKWSPDGRHLVFHRPLYPASGQHVDLYAVELATGTITRVTNGGGWSSGGGQADWAPEQSIVFQRHTDFSDWELAVRDQHGIVTQLTNNSSDDQAPDWFPGGARAAFSSNVNDAGDILALDLATATQTPLTAGPDADFAPAVNCDGSRVAFARVASGASNAQIWVMAADGSAQVNISMNAAAESQPDWRCVPADATPPLAPTVTLTDPINLANRSAVAVWGMGEEATTASISVDDNDPATSPVTGTAPVTSSGYSASLDVSSLTDGTLTATVVLTDAAGNTGPAGMASATKDTVAPLAPTVAMAPDPVTPKSKTAVSVTSPTPPETKVRRAPRQ